MVDWLGLKSKKKEEIPILFSRPKDKAFFTTKDYVKHLRIARKIKIPKIPRCAAIVYSKTPIGIVKRKFDVKKFEMPIFDLYTFKYKGINMGICTVGFGASACGTLVEELSELGAQYFITIGSAGALQKNLNIGDFILSTGAIRDEGTSYHYLKPGKYAYPSERLNKAIRKAMQFNKLEFHEGYTWTTDAPFRETVKEVSKYKKEGVLCVEMETAGLFAVASYLKKDLASLFYVSDSLSHKEWNPQFHKGRIASEKKLLNVAFDAFHFLEKFESPKLLRDLH